MIGIIATLLASPLLIIGLWKDAWYELFMVGARFWARLILSAMGFKLKNLGKPIHKPNETHIFIANHTSTLDIMMMILLTKSPISFVGKAELAKIPIFSYFYKKTCVLVDRSNAESRKAVFDSVSKKIQNGKSIIIFPEGLVPDDESIILSAFKNGAFRMSKEHQLKIIPFVLYNVKDHFPFRFFSGSPGILKYKELEALDPLDFETVQAYKKYSFQLLKNELVRFLNKC